MFHQMRMVTALLLFFGALFMIQSDQAGVRESRHSCTAVAAFLQLTYLAAGAMVASEGYACFRALAYGVVGGRLGSYLSLSFGETVQKVVCRGRAVKAGVQWGCKVMVSCGNVAIVGGTKLN